MPTSSVVFQPEISERELDREVDSVNSKLNDAASDISADISTDVDAMTPAGGGGGGLAATSRGAGMLGLAEQRNDVLVQIRELLDEDFVGGDDGGSGGSTTVVTGFPGAGAGGGGAAAGLLAGTLGLGAIRYAQGQGMFGPAGKNTLQNRKQFEGFGAIEELRQNPLEGAATRFMSVIDPTGLGETAARALMNATTLDEELVSGVQRGIQFWQDLSWPPAPDWMNPFNSWSWPKNPDWLSPFAHWEWPSTPEWMNPFTAWEWPQTPTWLNNFINWQPEAPEWVYQIPGVNRPGQSGGGGGGGNGSRPNQANGGANPININVDPPQINLDPTRLASDLESELRPWAEQAVEDFKRELRERADEGSGFNATPGGI